MNTILIEKQGYRLLENVSLRRKGKKPLNPQKLNKKWEKQQRISRKNASTPFPVRISINDSTFDMDIKTVKEILDSEGIEYLEDKLQSYGNYHEQ